jgi:hypothetical protein
VEVRQLQAPPEHGEGEGAEAQRLRQLPPHLDAGGGREPQLDLPCRERLRGG